MSGVDKYVGVAANWGAIQTGGVVAPSSLSDTAGVWTTIGNHEEITPGDWDFEEAVTHQFVIGAKTIHSAQLLRFRLWNDTESERIVRVIWPSEHVYEFWTDIFDAVPITDNAAVYLEYKLSGSTGIDVDFYGACWRYRRGVP